MKIYNTPHHLLGIQDKLHIEGKELSGTKKMIFSKHLEKVVGEEHHEQLRKLLDQIDQQGERLSKTADIKELRRYKKLISDFLYEAVKYSHKFHKEGMLDGRGRYKVYAMIHKVDEQLDYLTQEVLMEEKDNVNILQRLDDIRGLLLDIMM